MTFRTLAFSSTALCGFVLACSGTDGQLDSSVGLGSGGLSAGQPSSGGVAASSAGGQSSGAGGVLTGTGATFGSTGGMAQGSGGLATASGGTFSGAGGQGTGTGGALQGVGGIASAGGNASVGGSASGGSGAGGSGVGGSLPPGDCTFDVSKNEVSSKMATVGVVEWSVSGATPTDAKIVYEMDGATADTLNSGGEAPVDLAESNYRTLLLGLKQNSNYSFKIQATVGGTQCTSESFTLPQTGTLAGAPNFSLSVANAAAREPGFIIGSTGLSGGGGGGGGASAYIIDADGDIVWAMSAPAQSSRALMDYEGKNMWMMALNVQNTAGEMRYVSMDGQDGQNNVTGFSKAHHDFTVMPGGKIATMSWIGSGMDPESELTIRSPDGTVETPFKIGSNLYSSNSFHCNAIHYIPADDSFTISDRNPNLYVKVSSSGDVQWQLGGNCSGAPVGAAKCSSQSWNVNHGHHLLDDGTFLLFNNGNGGNSHIFEFDVTASDSAMTATLVKDYTGSSSSMVLGDVQRLPGGNTLISYSTSGKIIEVDSSWQVVQTFTGSVGYASWRPTLYGPPARL